MVILLLAMIVKDTVPVGDPNLLRFVVQALCLFIGTGWILVNLSGSLISKYWPVFGYILISLISGLMSERMEYALMQTASLAAVLFFAIAYFESQRYKPGDSAALYFTTVVFAYIIVCIVSILLIKFGHSIVYGRVGDWFDPRVGSRFRGLFSSAGMMAAASGLLIGFLLFNKYKWWWRLPAMASGLACLALTQSRTFWVATFVAAVITWWFFKPNSKKFLVAFSFGIAVMGISSMVLDVSINAKEVKKAARIDSVENLTGRVPLWEKAMERISKKPLVGYGSAVGSTALHDSSNLISKQNNRDDRSVGHETLHNGYLQTVLDLGIIGLLFYVMIFYVALSRVYRRGRSATNGAIFYGLLFMAVGNLGESIIFSAAVSHSVVFWFVATLALHRFAAVETSENLDPVMTYKNNNVDVINKLYLQR